MNDDSALENLDAGADLQEAKADGVELRGGQFGALQESAPERMREDVGGAVEEELKRIGLEPATTGAPKPDD